MKWWPQINPDAEKLLCEAAALGSECIDWIVATSGPAQLGAAAVITGYLNQLHQGDGQLPSSNSKPASFKMYATCVCSLFKHVLECEKNPQIKSVEVWTYLARPITEWYNIWHSSELLLPENKTLWFTENYWEVYKQANHQIAIRPSSPVPSKTKLKIKRLVSLDRFLRHERESLVGRQIAANSAEVDDLIIMTSSQFSANQRFDVPLAEYDKALRYIERFKDLVNPHPGISSIAGFLKTPKAKSARSMQLSFVPICVTAGNRAAEEVAAELNARCDSGFQFTCLHDHFRRNYSSMVHDDRSPEELLNEVGVELRYQTGGPGQLSKYEDVFLVKYLDNKDAEHWLGIAWDVDRVAGHADLVLLNKDDILDGQDSSLSGHMRTAFLRGVRFPQISPTVLVELKRGRLAEATRRRESEAARLGAEGAAS